MSHETIDNLEKKIASLQAECEYCPMKADYAKNYDMKLAELNTKRLAEIDNLRKENLAMKAAIGNLLSNAVAAKDIERTDGRCGCTHVLPDDLNALAAFLDGMKK